MSPRCQVCSSIDVVKIHEALLAGQSRRSVARAFGLERSAMDRHYRLHIPTQMKAAAARAEDERGPLLVDTLSGSVLLGLAAEQYQRSKDLLDSLEMKMSMPGAVIDVRAVVASLREVRQSVESLAKLSFTVSDRPQQAKQSERPSIDAAIVKAMALRGVAVDEDEQTFAPNTRSPDGSPLALPPGPEDD